MKKNQNKILAVLLITGLTFTTALSFARSRKRGHGRDGIEKMIVRDRFLKRIGVNTATREKIRKIMFDAKQKMDQIKYKIGENAIIIIAEYQKKDLDISKIRSLQNTIGDLIKQKHVIRSSARLKAAKLLTYEQRMKVMESMRKTRRRGKGRGDRGPKGKKGYR